MRRIHFIGIGGSGMCGIAEVLANLGYEVSGSDLVHSAAIDRLNSIGITTSIGHRSKHVDAVDAVVVSSAVPATNVELVAAAQHRIPIVQRAEMLGELMRHRFGIAVAGTHGKTTTTSLIASVFQAAGLDPTYVIGGLLRSAGHTAQLGASKYLIAEADESDASFLYLQPMLAVVTNVDEDHMETYEHDVNLLRSSFTEFVHRLPFYGAVALCIDDPGSRALVKELTRPLLTYGLSEEADFRAIDIDDDGEIWRFRVLRPTSLRTLEIELHIPGVHNVRNALAAIAIATDENIPANLIEAGIREFRGVGRRFEVSKLRVAGKEIRLVDDYGHHPTEIDHVVATARKVWPGQRLVMAFQPHRFTRTRDLFDRFVESLQTVDCLIVVDTFSAGEDPLPGADARSIVGAVQAAGTSDVSFAGCTAQAAQALVRSIRHDDVVIVQGAGNIREVADHLKALSCDG